MNREIKFRAYIGNKFIYSDDLSPDFAEVKQYKNKGLKMLVKRPKLLSDCIHSGNAISNHGQYEAEWYELQQFTGLKDKNGTEIYEGDVLHDGKGPDGVVVWNDAIAAFIILVGNQYYWLNEGNPTKPINLSYTTVMGNIYENPDLLK